MSQDFTQTQIEERTNRSRKFSIKKAILILALSAGLIAVGFEGPDLIESLRSDATSSPDGGAGYGDTAPIASFSFGKIGPGYSTGRDDKRYLRLPGVPNSPRISR